MDWLQSQGCNHYYFKYASTLDSTPSGNIGSTIEALMAKAELESTITCPALPSAERTTLRGIHYVEGTPLHTSAMANHPLTPMRESNVIKLLQGHTPRTRIGMMPLTVVAQGADMVLRHGDVLRRDGCGIVVVDAVADENLQTVATAYSDATLLSGSSGLIEAVANLRVGGCKRNVVPENVVARPRSARRAILSGSRSPVTQRQAGRARKKYPTIVLDSEKAAASPFDYAKFIAERATLASAHPSIPVLVSSPSSQGAGLVPGSPQACWTARKLEETLGLVARNLVDLGYGQLIITGGETSGAVLDALGIHSLRFFRAIDGDVLGWLPSVQMSQRC